MEKQTQRDHYAQNGHQPELSVAACSILLCFGDLKGHLFPLWSWRSTALQKGSFLFCVWVLFKAIHLGSPCQWAAMLEQCWVCIYRLESFSFWFCLRHFKGSMQCIAMTAFLDGCINKVTSTFPTWNEPRIAEGKMFQIVPSFSKKRQRVNNLYQTG